MVASTNAPTALTTMPTTRDKMLSTDRLWPHAHTRLEARGACGLCMLHAVQLQRAVYISPLIYRESLRARGHVTCSYVYSLVRNRMCVSSTVQYILYDLYTLIYVTYTTLAFD